MRWGLLFGDIEAQLEEALRLEREAGASELERAEFATVRFVDRLRGAEGRTVTVDVAGAGRLSGVLRRVGCDWLVLEEGASDWLIGAPSIRSVAGPASSLPPEDGVVWNRLGVASALRVVSRDRSPVRVFLVSDGPAPAVLSGVIARVGADFLELWEAGLSGETARQGSLHTIPVAALRAVQSGAAVGAFSGL